MTKRIVLVALAALCAIAFSAVAASGASAAGETAYTCVETTPSGGTGSDCELGTTGNFGHVTIPANTPTQLTFDNIAGESTQTLFAEVFGAEIELIGTGVECVGCSAENHESGGVMDVTGAGGKIKYTGVIVGAPFTANCEVKDPTDGSEVVTTQPLEVTTISENTAEITPVSPPVLAVIHIVAKAGKTCIIAGEYPVEGHADGTTNGSIFSVETGAGELTIFEEEAKLTGKATLTAGPENQPHHAVALTAS